MNCSTLIRPVFLPAKPPCILSFYTLSLAE
jgi:hypothetical protein